MTQTFHFQLHEVEHYINWLYFFHAWGFPSRFGVIALCDGWKRGEWLQSLAKAEQEKAKEAIKLYDDAQQLLTKLDGGLQTHARVALLPAFSDGDDIVVTVDNQQDGMPKAVRIPLLRQQKPGDDGVCWCLSDFISPSQPSPQAGDDAPDVSHTLGIFVATVDAKMEQSCKDDAYRHLLHQTLADRLAEATAERVHEKVRKEVWGYAPDEHLAIPQLFEEKYQGKRPAVGYPSLPDQSLNFILDDILDFGGVGVSLTEAGAMLPHASTSGLMLAHPAARHFRIGTIGDDQRADYARRRGMKLEQMKRFLSM